MTGGQNVPEFAADADVRERHGNERKDEDEQQHVELIDGSEGGWLPVLVAPVTDARLADLL